MFTGCISVSVFYQLQSVHHGCVTGMRPGHVPPAPLGSNANSMRRMMKESLRPSANIPPN